MNSTILSRLLNNYFDTLQLDNNIKQQLKILLNNKLYVDIQDQFEQILKQKYIKDFLQIYPECINIINDKSINIQSKINNFIFRISKKYLNEHAQKEIQNNIQYPINSQVNNLSFSSQDPYFREAPIVICREFLKNNQYKDHILVRNPGKYHDDVLQEHKELINKCYDNNNQLIFVCLYLYSNNIIYISSREVNFYSSINKLVQILKNQYKSLNSIFYVQYNGNIKNTKHLAKKIL